MFCDLAMDALILVDSLITAVGDGLCDAEASKLRCSSPVCACASGCTFSCRKGYIKNETND